KVDVCRKDVPDEMRKIDHAEGSAVRLEGERVDTAVYARPGEINQEKMFPEFFGQSGPRVISHPRRSLGDVRNGRNNVSRLTFPLRVPELLRIPGPALNGRFHELIADAPSAIAPFNQVNPAGLIASVGVIIPGKQIAILVEHKFLRIAQSVSENFQV